MPHTIGTVVSLKSNALMRIAEYNFIHLGGIEHFTTPLLVIVEVLHGKKELDEETGKSKNKIKGSDKYKCIYFSNRSMKFEENWFHENELKKYNPSDKDLHKSPKISDIKWGNAVRFKTIDEESKKKKSYNEGRGKGSKPLLNYTCPVLQVIGFKSVDKKEPLIDQHDGSKIRTKSQKLIKCKFFNSEADKFSEQLVPIESLMKIDNSGIDELLASVSDAIENKLDILIETSDIKYFGKPESVHVISGRYQLIFYNELLKTKESIWMDSIISYPTIDANENSKYYPGIQEEEGQNTVVDIRNFIDQLGNDIEGKTFKIIYKNLKDQITSRFVKVRKKGSLGKDESKVYYLNSYCFYREAEREFRSDRILSLRTIENSDLLNFLDLQVG